MTFNDPVVACCNRDASDCDCPPKWIVGWNMPGYLPESDPATFIEWHEAQMFMVGEINRFWDQDSDAHRIHVPGDCHAECPDPKWLPVETSLNAATRDEPWSALTGDGRLVLWISRYEDEPYAPTPEVPLDRR